MALHGSTVPTDHGEFVVTVICPNAYSRDRLMQAMQNIVPEAADLADEFAARVAASGETYATDGSGNTAAEPSSAEVAAAALREWRESVDDDEGAPGEPPRCKTGGCD